MTSNLLFLGFFALTFNSGAQLVFDEAVSKIEFDSTLLAKNNYRSIHVFSEMIDDATYQYQDSANYVLSRKREEIDLNSLGQIIYHRYTNVYERSYALGDKETRHYKYEYDKEGRIILLCELADWRDNCVEFEYDNEGHILQLKNTGKNIRNELYEFTWENGKMVTFKNSSDESDDYTSNRKFDEKGRIERVDFNSTSYQYKYTENKEILRTEISVYTNDSLISKVITDKRLDFNVTTYLLSLNGNSDTLREVIISHDKNGNVTKGYRADYSERYRYPYNQKPIPPVTIESAGGNIEMEQEVPGPRITEIEVDNIYSKGLLVKRTIRELSDNSEKVIIVERVIYEKEPLILRSWPVELDEEYYDSLEQEEDH